MRNFLAFLLLITTSPLMLLLCFLCLIFQGRPVFFLQYRLGLNKEMFNIYKLRTMKDNQVTHLGRLLRASSLDELPQLINIIKDDMAFIGPRPLTSYDVKRLKWDNSTYDIRWSILPGLTGLSQTSSICSRENTWNLDKHYCLNKSITMNIKIIFSTVFKGFKSKRGTK